MGKEIGILLVNLGTPDSPSDKDVHRYLTEFLTDKRVITTPWIQRQMVVRGFIVPARYKQSAASYRAIWTEEGSPLKVYGLRVKEALQKRLGSNYLVELAMRYQNPSIPKTLSMMQKAGIQRLLVIPLFPQYSSATTGSVHQKVMEEISKWTTIPEIIMMGQFATHPGYIDAICRADKEKMNYAYDHVLFSFHGLPQSQITKADPTACCLKKSNCCSKYTELNRDCYAAQCYATARAVAAQLNLKEEIYSVSFQSRLGKEPWLEPYTNEVIKNLAKEGKKDVLVFCPSFVCDCLETIYEIGVEYAHEFKQSGGNRLDLAQGLNDSEPWIDALERMIFEKLGGKSSPHEDAVASSGHR